MYTLTVSPTSSSSAISAQAWFRRQDGASRALLKLIKCQKLTSVTDATSMDAEQCFSHAEFLHSTLHPQCVQMQKASARFTVNLFSRSIAWHLLSLAKLSANAFLTHNAEPQTPWNYFFLHWIIMLQKYAGWAWKRILWKFTWLQFSSKYWLDLSMMNDSDSLCLGYFMCRTNCF